MAASRPVVPFRQFVLKMHSRCDLACDYCYVYEHQDTSWRHRPRVPSVEVLRQAAARIAEHARRHRIPEVEVVLHGGEPLLAGPERIAAAAEALRGALAGTAALRLAMQTNGLRLDEPFCELLLRYGIRVGVSLDGDRRAHDRHRRRADGRGSHDAVLRAVALLDRPRYRRLYAGLLCTVDVRNDPAAVYDALVALHPPRIDFLLPHHTWDHPPPRPDGRPAPYADWLLRVFDRWQEQGRPVEVRMFASVLSTLRGGPATTEALGLEPVDLLVIETDGTLEQADSLKTAYDGAPATGLDVFTDDLDRAARHPGVAGRQQGLSALAPACRACPVVRHCGGGLYAHRYRSGSGFANPSVYCPDLLALVTGIRQRTAPSAPGAGPAAAVPRRPGGSGADPAVPAAGGVPLGEEQYAELARGLGGPGTVRTLRDDQLAIGRTLLGALLKDDQEGPWTALLLALDAEAPEALDAVLAHPYTRTWAVRCLDSRRGRREDPRPGLAELAAAALVRAGRPEPVAVPLRAGVLRLPGLGRLLLGGPGAAVVTPGEDGFWVRTAAGTGLLVRLDGGPQDPRWQPVRRVAYGRWQAGLEDTDPCRRTHGWPAAGRLRPAEAAAWQRQLTAAWRLLDAELPEYAAGLAAGLAAVTPLRPGRTGEDRSSASRHAFGAVAAARPGTGPAAVRAPGRRTAEEAERQGAERLALLLLHEFQHVKLGGVLDRQPLVDPADRRLFTVRWRPDPRPLEGLLQGVYAHAAVADFWHARARSAERRPAGPEEVRRAREQYGSTLAATREALDVLERAGGLTPRGEQFRAGLAERLERNREIS